MEDLVAEALCAQLAPNLLHGVHFGCARRDVNEQDIVGNDQGAGFVPTGAVAGHHDEVIGEEFRQFAQVDVHHLGVALWRGEEKRRAVDDIGGPVGVAVLADVMTWHGGTGSRWAPTSLWFIYAPEAGFVLGHQADFAR